MQDLMNVMSMEYVQEIKHSRAISKFKWIMLVYAQLYFFILKHLDLLPRAANEEK